MTAVPSWCVLLVAGGLLVWSPPSRAQQKATKKEGAQSESEESRESGYPSNHFKNKTEIRRGSILRQEEPEEPQPDIELRGEYERRRDHEVIHHFRRLAEIDAIIEVARKNDEAGLVDRAESVRRLEQERFRLAMDRLRTVLNTKRTRGMP